MTTTDRHREASEQDPETLGTHADSPAAPALGNLQRGFPPHRLDNQSEPKIRKDGRGYYIMTISENLKVYFEDHYNFLELIADRCAQLLNEAAVRIDAIPATHAETLAFCRARRIILDLLMRTIRSFYSDGHNLGVIMTPWCFGTVVLEKVEMLRDRISRGDASHLDVGDFPYDVVRYIDEIRVQVLMEVLEFPPKAFAMRWQYTELIRRYSSALSNVTTSLQTILDMMKKHGK
ncbi:MAG TPA: hypothetical protein VGB22_00880 [candidate division Zixibacteria bacterium]|jgi:hypothetical protein